MDPKEFINQIKDALIPDLKQAAADAAKEAVEKAKGEEPAPSIMRAAAAPVAPTVIMKEDKPVSRFARIIRAQILGKQYNQPLEVIVPKLYPKDEVLKTAVSGLTLASGSALISEAFSAEVIEMLRQESQVRKAGFRMVPMPKGNMTMPGFLTGATASYGAEATTHGSTRPTFRQIALHSKKLIAIVPVSNDLVENADADAEALIRDDAVASIAEIEEAAFLRYDGASNKPKGLLYSTNSANKIAANTTVNVTNVAEDLGKLPYYLKKNKVNPRKGVWFISPRSEFYLKKARDANSNLVFADEMKGGTLLGFPYFVTTSIPENVTYGGTSNNSEVYFVDAFHAIIADEKMMEVEVFPGGTYYDSDSSALVSGISNDLNIVRVISKHDFALRHDYACAILEGVRWGA